MNDSYHNVEMFKANIDDLGEWKERQYLAYHKLYDTKTLYFSPTYYLQPSDFKKIRVNKKDTLTEGFDFAEPIEEIPNN